MKKHILVLAMLYLLAVVLIPCSKSGSPDSAASSEYTQDDAKLVRSWLYRELKTIERIRVGSTRADLLEVFEMAGGLSTRKSGLHVHRKCSYIQVLVEFEPVADKDNKLDQLPTDRITKISKPYLKSTFPAD